MTRFIPLPLVDREAVQKVPNRCPHLATSQAHCKASFSGLPVSPERRHHFCETEDYDLCGIFLARMLRQSSALPYTAAVDTRGR